MAIGFTGQPVPPGMRSGATTQRNSQRCLLRAHRRQPGQVHVVDQRQAHADDADLVHRERPVGDAEPGRHVGDAVAHEQRDLALVQPRQALRVESGHAVAERVEAAALRRRAGVAPAADDQEVATLHRRALGLLGPLEVGDRDRRCCRRGHRRPGRAGCRGTRPARPGRRRWPSPCCSASRCSSRRRRAGRCTSRPARTCGTTRRGG